MSKCNIQLPSLESTSTSSPVIRSVYHFKFFSNCCSFFQLSNDPSVEEAVRKRNQKLFRIFAYLAVMFLVIGMITILTYLLWKDTISESPSEVQEKYIWTSWSPWATCQLSIKLRSRKCMNLLGLKVNKCKGLSEQIKSCSYNEDEDEVIEESYIWTPWSEWSNCSKSCKDLNLSSRQKRVRSCLDQNGGSQQTCRGEKEEYKICYWIDTCKNDTWGPWRIDEPCQSRLRNTCSSGIQKLKRKCLLEHGCTGIDERLENCWVNVGCPVNLQSPSDLELISYGNSNFNISWATLPYGERISNIKIYITMKTSLKTDIRTISRDVPLQHSDVYEKKYWKYLNLKKQLIEYKFGIISVHLTSVGLHGQESNPTEHISSFVKSIDGQWSPWGYWKGCSTNCLGERGKDMRYRTCTSPRPSLGGKSCKGYNKQEIICLGMESEQCL